jgi:nucleotide sugar dehydrogenase
MEAATTPRVAVIGFGYIGSVVGATLANRGCQVIGVDLDPQIVAAVAAGRSPFSEEGLEELIAQGLRIGTLRVTSDVSQVAGCDVFIITVGTPLGDAYGPDVSHLQAACRAIEPYVVDGTLIIVKSTVPPHTTADVVGTAFPGKDVDVAFCPERLAEGRAIPEFESLPIVVGGLDERSTAAAKAFWESVLDVEVIAVSDAVVAEMVKLADNLWIDLNIALAGELAKLSDALGIDVLEVIGAANTLPKGSHHVNILMPSVGVGGYCLTKDPWFVHHLGTVSGVELRTPVVSREVNDSMPVYSAEIVDAWLTNAHTGVDRAQMKVAVLGVAFKNDTGDCRFTPTTTFITELVERGYRVEACDPLVSSADAMKWFGLALNPSIRDTMEGADCVAILAGHSVFKELTARDIADSAAQGALVFDGRRFYTRAEIEELRSAGLEYRGVGRI